MNITIYPSNSYRRDRFEAAGEDVAGGGAQGRVPPLEIPSKLLVEDPNADLQ